MSEPSRPNHLSASSIAAIKKCPQLYRLAYVEGLRPDTDTTSQRRGTNWHKLFEVAAQADWDPVAAVVTHLNECYAEVPASITPDEWSLERQILVSCFVGHRWYWEADPVKFLGSEIPFELPLRLPRTGLPLPTSEVLVRGKIDHVVRWHDSVCVLERKSTTRSIADDGDYWDRLRKDTQVSLYALAFKDLTDLGGLLADLAIDGAKIERYGNTLYDVFHWPTIKPAKLTQAETAAFIETGEYCGQKFSLDKGDAGLVAVDGCVVESEVGKSGKQAVKETVGMYGARLLQDIQERPTFYFARREIARTDAELQDFRQQLFAVYQAQKAFTKAGCWFENESQCRATFPCPMIPICYGPGADAVCDGVTVPNGYKRIFTPLTVKGLEQEE